LLVSNQTRPNGIAFSPDERTLYVANSDAENKVWMAYDVLSDGTLGEGRVFFDVNDQTETGAADGMKVDVNGNIFATGPGGVWIFDSSGKHLGTIKPDEVPANVAWGGDGSTLYMTARTGLYKIELSTRGKIP
jgi:gluconolactonase